MQVPTFHIVLVNAHPTISYYCYQHMPEQHVWQTAQQQIKSTTLTDPVLQNAL
jgi:hypothetical protein